MRKQTQEHRQECLCHKKKNQEGPGSPGPYEGKNWLAEEPAEEGLLPGGAVYFGYGFG